MANTFSPDVSDRMCKHMNDDHAEAVLVYGNVFGGAKEAIAALMLKIDADGMDLQIQQAAATAPVRITFDHILQDSEDAHQTLIAMVKQARAN